MKHHIVSLIFVVAATMVATPKAHAQFAVIDLASVAQLIQQAETLNQELQQARAQVAQAQSLYQSMTGGRGMDQLLSGVVRNYLPTDWSQLGAALQSPVSPFAALSAGVRAAVSANAVLSASQLSSLTPDEQSRITAGRNSVALIQALSEQALSNSSSRFASIQQLISAIPTATDEKGALDLQARIGAEQNMLANEQTKLQVLYQAAQSQALAVQQREREQIVSGHGHFASRFEPAPL